MRREHVRDLLRQVADGSLDTASALNALSFEPVESLGFATIDHHRALRQGFPEVVYGAGKTPAQIAEIGERIVGRGDALLVTRISDDGAAALAKSLPNVQLNALARTAYLPGAEPPTPGTGTVAVVTAGTSDLPVAEEAAVTLRRARQLRVARHRRRRRRHPSCARSSRRIGDGRRCHRNRGNGRSVAEGRGRVGERTCDRRADERRIRRFVSGHRAASHDAEQLRRRCDRGEYRQRLWRRRGGIANHARVSSGVKQLVTVVMSMAAGAAATLSLLRRRDEPKPQEPTQPVTRFDALLSSAPAKVATATSEALRRDVQEVFENKEAAEDLAILDRLLVDIADLTGGEEAIFWRWVESRETLVPAAWSTEEAPRPSFFDIPAWSPMIRWTAEERLVQFLGPDDRTPILAAAPVIGLSSIYGVLSVSAAAGLALDRELARAWLQRFATQVASLIQLFDLRRDYGRQKRQSEALLDAVRRLHQHRSAEALGQALCDTAREVTSAPTAGLVRWSAADGHGVIQAISPESGLEAGFHVTADSLIGRACTEQLPFVMEDAVSATMRQCPYGGLARAVGSMAIVPVLSADQMIGALVVESPELGAVGQHEARNVGLLAAVARGPLEIIWEIEEVTLRARTDPLTGLANRRHFDEQLRRVVAETDRFGGTCSLIMADLDHFKSVNDRFGHEAGDAVLRHVAAVLGEAVRTVDLCARYGGEEIAVLLPQTSQMGALELAERLRATLETRPAMSNGRELLVTASFGVATYPQPVPYGDWLLLAADKALYEAKAAGRNCVRFIPANYVTPALYKAQP